MRPYLIVVGNPLLHQHSRFSVIASHVLWNTADQYDICKQLHHIVVPPASTRHAGTAFVRMFVQNIQKPILSNITGFVFYKIITPYRIFMLCFQTDAAVIC